MDTTPTATAQNILQDDELAKTTDSTLSWKLSPRRTGNFSVHPPSPASDDRDRASDREAELDEGRRASQTTLCISQSNSDGGNALAQPSKSVTSKTSLRQCCSSRDSTPPHSIAPRAHLNANNNPISPAMSVGDSPEVKKKAVSKSAEKRQPSTNQNISSDTDTALPSKSPAASMPVANKSGPPTTSGRINGVAKRKRRSITAASSETPPNTENNGSILPASNNTKPRDRGPATTSTVSTISTSERSSHNTPSTKERSQKKTSKSKGDHRDHPKMALQPCISGLGICKDNTSLYAPLGSETGRIPDSGEFDVVELEYPGVNANELFPLLTPAKPLEYNPTKDIYLTTQMIVEHCIPPHLSDALGDVRTGILRSIQRAVHRKSPEDLKASVQQWNEVMVSLKKDQRAFAEGEFTGPAASYQMVSHILEQAYSRSVAPSSGLLNNYEGFSNNVYGEVKHNFVNTIIQEAKIRPHHIFVDMGSGIANVVLQVAAQCLCYSYGIEVMDIPAELAVKQKKEFVSRMRYYAKPCGRIKLRHGDFLEDPNITEVIKSADVIFVNNYAFSAELNQRILGLFLDLKEKATVISLRSFLPVDRPTARSARRSNAIESIFTVKEHYFGRDCVSWMNEGGRYYIHTVDRNQLARRTSMRSSAN